MSNTSSNLAIALLAKSLVRRFLFLGLMACSAIHSEKTYAWSERTWREEAMNQDYEIIPVQNSIDVEPGEQALLAFDVRMGNLGGIARFAGRVYPDESISVGERIVRFADLWDQYQFIPFESPLCHSPQLTMSPAGYNFHNFEFAVGPLAAQSTIRCTYRVVRHSSSRDDLLLGYRRFHDIANTQGSIGEYVDGDYKYSSGTTVDDHVALGSLVEVSTQAELIQADWAEPSLLYRITTTNQNAHSLSIKQADNRTPCFTVGPRQLPFTFETDFPGGCLMTTINSCGISFGGVSNQTFIFGSGILAANTSNSCLVRIRYRTVSNPSESPNSSIQLNNSPTLLNAQRAEGWVGFYSDVQRQFMTTDGRLVQDRDPTNSVVEIGLGARLFNNDFE
jgi:hypothetical protein